MICGREGLEYRKISLSQILTPDKSDQNRGYGFFVIMNGIPFRNASKIHPLQPFYNWELRKPKNRSMVFEPVYDYF